MASLNAPEKLRSHVFRDERYVDLNLYQFGRERCEPLHSFGPYVRNHYLFHFVLAGRGTLSSGEQKYAVRSGQGFLICPGQVTSYAADETNPWEYVWLEFDGLCVPESLHLAGLSDRNPVYRAVNPEAAQALQQSMLYLVDHNTASPTALIGRGFLFLDQLVQSSAGRIDAGGRRLRDFYMKEALSFIEQNYQNDVSVEQIADFCGLNRSYFGKIFRSTMGEAPQRFLMYYRMARAAQFLKESTLSVGAIGAMVGYANQLHFSRAFKAVYGVCPREYRQNHFIRPLRSPADQLRSRPSSENAEGACREDIQGYKD